MKERPNFPNNRDETIMSSESGIKPEQETELTPDKKKELLAGSVYFDEFYANLCQVGQIPTSDGKGFHDPMLFIPIIQQFREYISSMNGTESLPDSMLDKQLKQKGVTSMLGIREITIRLLKSDPIRKK